MTARVKAASVIKPTNGDVLVDVRDLSVEFGIGGALQAGGQVVRAVNDVSLQIRRGETLGLVGESGCGKSTLGRALLNLVRPSHGTVHIDGTDVTSLKGRRLRAQRKHIQMVFQDPYASLNPRQSVGRALAEPIRAHGLAAAGGMDRRIFELLDQVGLPANAIARYPHEFSGGQRQRIGLARALAVEPSLIVADEPVSSLDVSVQAQILNLLLDLQDHLGLTYLFISHDLSVVRHMSDRVAVMYLGEIVELTGADALYNSAAHPYTHALLASAPLPDPKAERARGQTVPIGDAPNAADPPPGCRFNPRCVHRRPGRCTAEHPLLHRFAEDHQVACHFAEDIASLR